MVFKKQTVPKIKIDIRTYNHQQDSFNSIFNVNKGSLGLATVHKLEGLSSEKILQTKENRKF